MPFLIEVTRAEPGYAGGESLTFIQSVVSRRAVGTHREAREAACEAVPEDAYSTYLDRANSIPPSGGCVVLPDGGRVSVEPWPWQRLANDLGQRGYLAHRAHSGDQEAATALLAAFNREHGGQDDA
jgi:hypothetical protein